MCGQKRKKSSNRCCETCQYDFEIDIDQFHHDFHNSARFKMDALMQETKRTKENNLRQTKLGHQL